MKKNALWLLLVLMLPAIACSRKPEKKVTVSSGRKEEDLVTGLPGQPPVNFRHYAGYVDLGPRQKQKSLFYWFFEAQHNSSGRPLVLWLNGGPGCSSVAYGAAQELGPFLVRTNGGNLTFNDFSWNKEANMLFLEAPVGVGFSYTNNSVDLGKLGDQVTAEDSLDFLINWFTKFPEFRSSDFYLTGESYAGHYVPQLAEVIYDRNKKVQGDSRINLKGFMIGNAAINEETDMAGLIDYAWSHAIVSDELHSNLHSTCGLDEEQTSNTTIQCYENIKAFMEAYNDIDIYSIYTPVCLSSDSSSSFSQRRPKLVVSPSLFTYHDMWDKFPASGYDPCTEAYTENYFNRKDVQVALHANVTNLPYPYTPCSGVIRRWGEAPSTVLPIIQKLLTGGLRIWIYSGDTDGRVPVTSTRYSIKKMGSKVQLPWRSWFHESQVAGWVETYAGGLTFATVRGAGHQVPVFAPAQSLTLFSHFLSSTPLPSKRF
ncbi:serine carboxypeptidase-like 35 [Brassica rapa]|uniref:serine carboxypeptidase-like 35 n=1 Tax=Brassica campestris TaxID=3711 RepID=UPI0004F1A5D4|nr:serine carboxypeptidase-like 35 [Brassica rapa]